MGMNKQGKAVSLEQFGRYQKCREYLEKRIIVSSDLVTFLNNRHFYLQTVVLCMNGENS